jgi:hypothetical protein
LCARPEGNSTHFERSLFVDTQAVLDAIEKEYSVTIVDEDDPRFWGFSTWDDMRRQREEMEQRKILVEGPCTRDARFAVAWLSSAIELDQRWNECLNGSVKILRVEVSAMEFVQRWLEGNGVFSLYLHRGMMAETLLVMAELGFLTLTGNRYQMTLPGAITKANVRRALFRLIEIQDEHELAHLENLFAMLSESEVENWMDRLKSMDLTERLGDRNLLLQG